MGVARGVEEIVGAGVGDALGDIDWVGVGVTIGVGELAGVGADDLTRTPLFHLKPLFVLMHVNVLPFET